jgi:hypothetical protein
LHISLLARGAIADHCDEVASSPYCERSETGTVAAMSTSDDELETSWSDDGPGASGDTDGTDSGDTDGTDSGDTDGTDSGDTDGTDSGDTDGTDA